MFFWVEDGDWVTIAVVPIQWVALLILTIAQRIVSIFSTDAEKETSERLEFNYYKTGEFHINFVK